VLRNRGEGREKRGWRVACGRARRSSARARARDGRRAEEEEAVGELDGEARRRTPYTKRAGAGRRREDGCAGNNGREGEAWG
jgi:hypothetical protein